MTFAFPIGRISGIPIRLDITWFFFALAIVVLLERIVGSWPLAILGGVLIYAANLGHELAHVAIIRSSGGTVHDIIVFALGTVARTSGELSNPKLERKQALAGPLYSFLLGGALIALALAMHGPHHNPAIDMTVIVALITIGYGCFFNLIPAWPMDGGRALHSWLQERGILKRKAAGFMLGITWGLCGSMILWALAAWILNNSIEEWPKAMIAGLVLVNAVITLGAQSDGKA